MGLNKLAELPDRTPNIRYEPNIHWTSKMLKFEIDEQELLDRLINVITGLPDGEAKIDRREASIGPRGRVDALIEARSSRTGS